MKLPSHESEEMTYIWHCGRITPGGRYYPHCPHGVMVQKKVTYRIHVANTEDLRHEPSLVKF